MKLYGLIAGMALLASCAGLSTTAFDSDKAIEYCCNQTGRSLRQLSADSIDYNLMPRNIAATDSVWHCRRNCPEECSAATTPSWTI